MGPGGSRAPLFGRQLCSDLLGPEHRPLRPWLGHASGATTVGGPGEGWPRSRNDVVRCGHDAVSFGYVNSDPAWPEVSSFRLTIMRHPPLLAGRTGLQPGQSRVVFHGLKASESRKVQGRPCRKSRPSPRLRCAVGLQRRDSSLPHIGITGSVRQCVDLHPGVTVRVDRDFDYNPGN